MTLKFVKYLYCSALERGFAQLQWKMPGILFQDATLRDQRADAHCPRPLRFHIRVISLQC